MPAELPFGPFELRPIAYLAGGFALFYAVVKFFDFAEKGLSGREDQIGMEPAWWGVRRAGHRLRKRRGRQCLCPGDGAPQMYAEELVTAGAIMALVVFLWQRFSDKTWAVAYPHTNRTLPGNGQVGWPGCSDESIENFP